MNVSIDIPKLEKKDIRMYKMQVWDNRDNELILTVGEGDDNYRIISLTGPQRLLMPTFTEEELVEYLNKFRYVKKDAGIMIQG